MYNALIKTLYRNANTQYIADDIIYQQLIHRDTTTGQMEDALKTSIIFSK